MTVDVTEAMIDAAIVQVLAVGDLGPMTEREAWGEGIKAALAHLPPDPEVKELKAELAEQNALIEALTGDLEQADRIMADSNRFALSSKAERDTLKAQLAEAMGALLQLANAADEVGVSFFDTDTMEPEVEAMQSATLCARQTLQSLSSPTNAKERWRNKALEEAAKVLDKRIETVVEENGHWEPDTNHTNLPEWAETAIEELEEQASAIRALKVKDSQ